MPTRIKASEYRERKRAAEDGGALEIEADDGQVFTVDPPELWPDDVMAMAAANDTVGAVRMIVGDETFERWKAAGGTANEVLGMLMEHHGISLGE